jgi:formylglycine-generating enzyme required for sulfatase activity
LRGFILALVLLAPLGALAQASVAPEQRVALVIGNAAYQQAPLRNPINDARAVAARLERLGFVVIQRENLKAREIGPALREFRSRLSPGAVALFFYAGHGLQVRGQNYLPTVDASIDAEEDVPTQALDVGKVLELMDESKSRVNLVFLDACRNNPFSRRFRAMSRGLAKIDAPSGTLISFATRPGSVAADGEGENGLYTEYLLKHIEEAGLPIEQVLKRVGAGVKLASKGLQEPWSEGLIEGEFYFRAVSLAAQAAQPKGDASLVSVAAVTVPPASTKPVALASFRDCDECPEMVMIPAGAFLMGSPFNESRREADEGPQHAVKIAQRFALGKYEVTVDEFAHFVRETGHAAAGGCYVWNGSQWLRDAARDWAKPGYAQTGASPVTCVNWHDAKAYAEWLARKTGKSYRIASEAEWEYAARAGTSTPFNTGSSIQPTQANYNSTVSYAGSETLLSRAAPVAVGSYPPNAFRLHDTHGNVWEWTEDCYNPRYEGAPADGSAWHFGDCRRRVLRGGAWSSPPWDLRSASRYPALATDRFAGRVGFRVAAF